MHQRSTWIGLALLLLAMLSGCSAQPNTPEEATATVQTFMQARVAGDAAALHAMLTARAETAISRSQVSRHVEGIRVSYTGLGSPSAVEPGVVRIPVRNLQLAGPERTVQWPESWLTLRYEGDRWRVAWAEPLFDEAANAFMNDLLTDQLKLGHAIVAIDPYHYRGYLELHFAYRDLQRYREAEVAIREALRKATTAQEPDGYDALARFQLVVNAPGEALATARRALELAAPLVPDTYSVKWQADTLVAAGRAALAAGDRTTAEAYANQAAGLDPANASLSVFRHRLTAQPGAVPGR